VKISQTKTAEKLRRKEVELPIGDCGVCKKPILQNQLGGEKRPPPTKNGKPQHTLCFYDPLAAVHLSSLSGS